jgi:DNA modification methylase
LDPQLRPGGDESPGARLHKLRMSIVAKMDREEKPDTRVRADWRREGRPAAWNAIEVIGGPASRGQAARISSDVEQSLSSAKIELVPIEQLRPNPRNARRHSEKQIAQIADSIATFGFLVPIIVDDQGLVLAGHGRLAAAKRCGLREVPCCRISHLTPEAKRLFALADNRLAELSGWDEGILKLELAELEELQFDYDLSITGFDTIDLDRLLGPEPEPRHKLDSGSEISTDPDDHLPDLRQETVSRVGDLWQLGAHRVLCGDALVPDSYRSLLQGAVATQVFCDPPYNVSVTKHVTSAPGFQEFPMGAGEMSVAQFVRFLTAFMSETRRNVIDGAILHICMDWRHMREILDAADNAGLTLKNLCVWAKPGAGMGSFYRSQHELIFVFKIGTAPHINNFGLGARGRYRTNIWPYPSVRGPRRGVNDAASGGHPTVKPTALVVDAIKDCSHRGDIILDPFGGSGTTLVAAHRAGRKARLIELDPHYVDLIVRRFQALTGHPAVLEGDGRPFDAISRLGVGHESEAATVLPADADANRKKGGELS